MCVRHNGREGEASVESRVLMPEYNPRQADIAPSRVDPGAGGVSKLDREAPRSADPLYASHVGGYLARKETPSAWRAIVSLRSPSNKPSVSPCERQSNGSFVQCETVGTSGNARLWAAARLRAPVLNKDEHCRSDNASPDSRCRLATSSMPLTEALPFHRRAT